MVYVWTVLDQWAVSVVLSRNGAFFWGNYFVEQSSITLLLRRGIDEHFLFRDLAFLGCIYYDFLGWAYQMAHFFRAVISNSVSQLSQTSSESKSSPVLPTTFALKKRHRVLIKNREDCISFSGPNSEKNMPLVIRCRSTDPNAVMQLEEMSLVSFISEDNIDLSIRPWGTLYSKSQLMVWRWGSSILATLTKFADASLRPLRLMWIWRN